jgi:hypothetical protein
MNTLEGSTVRTQFNRQHRNQGSPEWVRLDVPGFGPLLAKRHIPHQSAQIYLLVVQGTGFHKTARHYIVTQKRELKSMGSTAISDADLNRWIELIGLTKQEYEVAKDAAKRRKYEKGS